MGSPTPRALLLPTAFLLSLLPVATWTHLPVARLRVIANFECKTYVHGDLPRPPCQRKLQEDAALPVPSIALSTVQLCQHDCQTCVRVRLALNATGIKGLELHFRVQRSNRFGWLQILKRRRRQVDTGTLWQVQFDCFQAEEGQRVLVSVKTIPDGMLSLSESLLVANKQRGPEFHHTWVPSARAIEVSVSESLVILVRLCHQLALECEELQQPFHRQELVSSHHPAVLPYELLLPCLCIEASYDHHDSVRKKVCPFQNRQEAYGPDLWSSTQFQDYSSSNKAEMVMSLSGRCLLHPNASLCWKESVSPEAVCQDIPNSTVAAGPDQEYVLEEVDVHPQLCFKFSFGNSSHTECPHQTDTAWNVSVSVRFLQLHLHFHSRIPASFSSVLCQPVSPSHCEPEPPVYTVTHLEGSSPGELDLILPWWVLRSCVLVWRSDVRFAGKQLLCPDVSHKRWGLLALGLGLGLGLLATVILLVRSGLSKLHRGTASKCHSRPILLIYSPDSEEHKQLVCAFAALLRSALGCQVLLDLWELNLVGRLGILPWMYAQREHVDREQGQVLLLWSAGSARAYGLWRGKANVGSRQTPEPHDLFGAAMACLQGELRGASGAMRQSEWVIAYFSKLCGRRDIPHALRYLPRYRLPQELPGLVRVLQGPSSSAPSWLRARAKTLVCRLLKAERKKGLRSRLYQPWKMSTGRLAGSLVPLAHPKLRQPSCT